MFENAPHVDVIDSPSVEEFTERYARRERPVVVRGGLGDWLPTYKWTPEYLKSVYGPRRVKVGVSKTGEFANYVEILKTGVDAQVTFAEVVDSIFSPKPGGDKLRLHQEPLETWDTFRDESPPIRFITREVMAKNIWMGSAGNITKAHYDTEDNINVQLRGKKEFILFPSSQLRELYPRSPLDYMSNFSQVELAAPDLVRFPRFRRATPMRAVIQPGDFLYIPIYWWHEVHTLEPSLNVNFWWQSGTRQSLRRNGLRYWPRMAKDGYLHRHVARTLGYSLASIARNA